MNASAYDSVAPWYAQWVAAWPPAALEFGRNLFPDDLAGARVLDVACGHGRLARELAGVGADVVGVDVSAELIQIARSSGPAGVREVRYHRADVADLDTWWDGELFDGAASEMALMDIADLGSAVDAVATVLRPGGWFIASLVHPCFPGNEGGLSSWPPEHGYSVEGFWTSPDHNPDGIRIRIGSHHRTLATYLNTLVAAGLSIRQVVEPPTTVPQFLILSCQRLQPSDQLPS